MKSFEKVYSWRLIRELFLNIFCNALNIQLFLVFFFSQGFAEVFLCYNAPATKLVFFTGCIAPLRLTGALVVSVPKQIGHRSVSL